MLSFRCRGPRGPHRLLPALALACAVVGPGAAAAEELFRDDFSATATQLDLSRWTTEFGPPSYLGRTQLRDWVTPGAVGQFNTAGGSALMPLNTYNPTGLSLYGTHAKTLASFRPTAETDIVLSVRMRLTTLQPGLIFGIYLYGCDAGPCATRHDELDIELLTNFLQPGAAPRLQLNRYADEPLGAGHGPVVALPSGFDPLAFHEWTITWGRDAVSYAVDGLTLFTATDFVPQGSMRANLIAWGPGTEWPAAYSAGLQPVTSAAADRAFAAEIDWVSVRAVPEPATQAALLAGLAVLALRLRGRRDPRSPETRG